MAVSVEDAITQCTTATSISATTTACWRWEAAQEEVHHKVNEVQERSEVTLHSDIVGKELVRAIE